MKKADVKLILVLLTTDVANKLERGMVGTRKMKQVTIPRKMR